MRKTMLPDCLTGLRIAGAIGLLFLRTGSPGFYGLYTLCGVSDMPPGYPGLYSSQTILYSKLKAEYINVHTNAYHAGDPHAAPPTKGSVKE